MVHFIHSSVFFLISILIESFSAFLSSQGSGQAIHLLASSEDGKWLASANSAHEVHVYNLKTMKVIFNGKV